MKTKILLLSFLLLSSVIGFCNTVTITVTGFSFTPSQANISLGDNVFFNLGSPGLEHHVREVSESTYNSEGTALLPGGFEVASSGTVPASQLEVGTHWYVCITHIGLYGMKGIIIVSALGIQQNQLSSTISFYPNPTTGLFTVKADQNIFGSAYRIVDQSGRQVLAGEVNEVSTVDISSLNSGIYFFQFGEERKQTFKILKE